MQNFSIVISAVTYCSSGIRQTHTASRGNKINAININNLIKQRLYIKSKNYYY